MFDARYEDRYFDLWPLDGCMSEAWDCEMSCFLINFHFLHFGGLRLLAQVCNIVCLMRANYRAPVLGTFNGRKKATQWLQNEEFDDYHLTDTTKPPSTFQKILQYISNISDVNTFCWEEKSTCSPNPNSSQKVIYENNVKYFVLICLLMIILLYIYNLKGNLYLLRRGDIIHVCTPSYHHTKGASAL